LLEKKKKTILAAFKNFVENRTNKNSKNNLGKKNYL